MKKRQARLSFIVAGGAACVTALSPAIGQQLTTGGTTAAGTVTPAQQQQQQQQTTTGVPQGTGTGLTVTLGLDSSLRYDDNLGLDDPSDGDTKRFENRLSLNVSSLKANEQLQFDLSGIARIVDKPNTGTDGGVFEDPSVGLSYARQGANSTFQGSANYREVDLDFFRPLTDVNLDGIIDESDLVDDNGTRNDTRLNLSLRTGVNAPLGFLFEVRHRDRDFRDTINPNLFDVRSTTGTVTSFLQLTQVTQGRVQLGFTDYEAEDPEQTNRETIDVLAGVNHLLSPVTTVDATVGFSRVDETLAAIPVSDTDTGATGSLTVTRTLGNGTIAASVDRVFGTNGGRTTARVIRDMALPSGTLSFSAGVTRGAQDSVTAIGSLNVTHVMPRSQIGASVERRVRTSSLNNEVRTTTANVNYTVTINNDSSMAFDAFYAQNADAGIGTAVERERTNLRATYNRSLTKDWGLSAGYEFRMSDESGSGSATGNMVFLTLQRQFTLKP
ncbi:hypothetical protein DDZ14_07820 [Maritimibacter sp. 55A14]|uniref:hypothetical protein n=1 Tax=Maritimibacter sp. 55A14 TaxID=2174844 RepID=UPI000D620E94|nr:hypothetical protein [Maritimibacter sp. 55A14]PWE32988.1 hypothetical protein DDZ14_07820 [Maritimibacter sp. 55A14]